MANDNNNKEEFNGQGPEYTQEEITKRVEEEKARIAKSHGGTEAPLESQPQELLTKQEAQEPNENKSSNSSSNSQNTSKTTHHNSK